MDGAIVKQVVILFVCKYMKMFAAFGACRVHLGIAILCHTGDLPVAGGFGAKPAVAASHQQSDSFIAGGNLPPTQRRYGDALLLHQKEVWRSVIKPPCAELHPLFVDGLTIRCPRGQFAHSCQLPFV